MKITKERFLLFVAAMLAIAGFLAWYLPSDSQDLGSADTYYLMLTVAAIALFLRIEAFTAALATAYGSSFLFCFFYLFIAPFEAPVMMTLFFVPALLWQKKKIGCLQLTVSAIVLAWLSHSILGRPAIIILLMPTCQILAIRLSSSFQHRYSKDGTEVGLLSRRRRQQNESTGKNSGDWWELIRPEIEMLPEKINELWSEMTGNAPRRHMGDDSVLDLNLLRMQNANHMSAALTSIKKRDEHFAPDSFINRVEKVFWKIQNAWYDQKIEPVQHLVSDALFEQFKCQIEEQKTAGIKFKHSQMTVYELRTAQVNCDNSFDVIHVFIRASSADSLIDLKTGEIIAENEDKRKFTEYWTFIRRPSAKTLQKPGLLEGNCPNCGSPIEIGQATVCPACRSFIRSGFYDWVLAKITQACEWEYSEPSLIPDWKQMKANDPDFTIQQIEDRAAVIFWMQRLAERSNSVEPMQRFATEAFCHYYRMALGDDAQRGYSFMENASLASVVLKGFKITKFWDSLYLLVTWSGVPVMRNNSGKIIETSKVCRVMRNVMILGRRHGVKTDQKNTLSSAHCPGCGAPLSSTFAIVCNYCNSVLNEGSNSWILEQIVSETDTAYLEILKKKTEIASESDEDQQVRSARDIVTVMAQMLLADGKVEISEMNLLEKIASSYGMSESDVNSIIWSLKQGQIHVPAPADSREAWSILLAASNMAIADGILTPDEEHELVLLAQHLGYSKPDVHRAIKAAETRRLSEEKENTRREAFKKIYGSGDQ